MALVSAGPSAWRSITNVLLSTRDRVMSTVQPDDLPCFFVAAVHNAFDPLFVAFSTPAARHAYDKNFRALRVFRLRTRSVDSETCVSMMLSLSPTTIARFSRCSSMLGASFSPGTLDCIISLDCISSLVDCIISLDWPISGWFGGVCGISNSLSLIASAS